jgi:hypothetical protein
MALTKLNYTGQGTIPIASIPTITGAKMPAGSVIQTIQGTPVSGQTPSSTPAVNTWTDLGLSINIQPSSTSSKILITANLHGSSYASRGYIKLVRDTTDVTTRASQGTTSTWKPTNMTFTHLDSPSSTNVLTYKIQYYYDASIYFNIPTTLASYIVIMAQEIAG